MFEIVRSWFNAYRFVPYAELKLDLQCHNPLKVEQYVHDVLAPVAFTPNKKVQGSTEMFTDLDTEKLKWFIKACANSRYEEFPKLSLEEAEPICKLLMV